MGTFVYYFVDFITTLAAGIYFVIKPEDISKMIKKSGNKSLSSIIRVSGVIVIIYGLSKLFNFASMIIN